MQQSFLYPLPGFLSGVVTERAYNRWLHRKAQWIFHRDQKRGKPYTAKSTRALYKALIHLAIVDGGECDPYTGEKLAWELIGTWDTSREQPEGYEEKFARLPTVDHKDPNVLDFEIVSWRVNTCKNYLTPEKFIALCRLVARRRR